MGNILYKEVLSCPMGP